MSSFIDPSNSPLQPRGITGLPRRPKLPIGVQAPTPKLAPAPHPFGVTAQPETHDYFKQMQAHFESPAGKEEAWGGASPVYRQFAENNYAEPGPIKPRTIYHSDGSVQNPPDHDPGYRIYNSPAEMPARDQAEMHAFRSGHLLPPPPPRPSPGDTTGGQLLGDPAKATPLIGVPARNQAPGPIGLTNGQAVGLQSVPATSQASLASPADMRNMMIEDLSRQMQAAHASGNSSALHDLFAQRAALDNGGFAGHARYMQDKETHAAQMEHMIGVRPSSRQLNPDGSINEDAFRATANARQGADAQQTEDTIQTMRIAKSIEDSRKAATPLQLNPNDAMKFLELKYPAYRSAWATNQDGTPARPLAEVYHHLKAIAPSLIGDPNSDFSVALREILRQQHGESLPSQLAVPKGWSFTNHIGGPGGSIVDAAWQNLWNGHGLYTPTEATANRIAEASGWFNGKKPNPKP